MQGRGFSSFASNMIKLSVNETKWSSLLARTRALILYISIWKFDFGPETLPGLSRNGPRGFLILFPNEANRTGIFYHGMIAYNIHLLVSLSTKVSKTPRLLTITYTLYFHSCIWINEWMNKNELSNERMKKCDVTKTWKRVNNEEVWKFGPLPQAPPSAHILP